MNGQSCAIHEGLTQSDKDMILAKHNELRSKVANGKQSGQPPAANMKKMVWDEELAKEAQNIASSTCVSDYGFVYWGRNTGNVSTSKLVDKSSLQPFWESIVQSWYDEVTIHDFNSDYVDSFVYKVPTNHYSQVVWAESSQIGCGGSFFKDQITYEVNLVCNYLQHGNWEGDSVYKVGTACSACSGGSCSNGICA